MVSKLRIIWTQGAGDAKADREAVPKGFNGILPKLARRLLGAAKRTQRVNELEAAARQSFERGARRAAPPYCASPLSSLFLCLRVRVDIIGRARINI